MFDIGCIKGFNRMKLVLVCEVHEDIFIVFFKEHTCTLLCTKNESLIHCASSDILQEVKVFHN